MQRIGNGRIALSIGKGIPRFLEKAGIEQHETAVKETITIVRRLVSGQRTSYEGSVYTIDGMRLRVHPPEKQVPIFQAAVSPEGWKGAMEVADGIATFWSDEAFKLRQQLMDDRSFPTVVLIPFAQSRRNFFAKQVTSVEELKERVDRLDAAGFEEVMVAYGELPDLEAAARVLI